jgi:hypothetical protein
MLVSVRTVDGAAAVVYTARHHISRSCELLTLRPLVVDRVDDERRI